MGSPRTDRIVLIGMMGCGKTTVGAVLAERLGWPFHDNDAILWQLFHASPRELLVADGEEAMQAAEVTALLTALAMPSPSVVGAAGGTILDAGVRTALAEAGLVVWLTISGQTVATRSSGGAHRPWPDEDRAQWIAQALRQREALYAAVADLVLEADTAAPQALADRIIMELEHGELARRP